MKLKATKRTTKFADPKILNPIDEYSVWRGLKLDMRQRPFLRNSRREYEKSKQLVVLLSVDIYCTQRKLRLPKWAITPLVNLKKELLLTGKVKGGLGDGLIAAQETKFFLYLRNRMISHYRKQNAKPGDSFKLTQKDIEENIYNRNVADHSTAVMFSRHKNKRQPYFSPYLPPFDKEI